MVDLHRKTLHSINKNSYFLAGGGSFFSLFDLLYFLKISLYDIVKKYVKKNEKEKQHII